MTHRARRRQSWNKVCCWWYYWTHRRWIGYYFCFYLAPASHFHREILQFPPYKWPSLWHFTEPNNSERLAAPDNIPSFRYNQRLASRCLPGSPDIASPLWPSLTPGTFCTLIPSFCISIQTTRSNDNICERSYRDVTIFLIVSGSLHHMCHTIWQDAWRIKTSAMHLAEIKPNVSFAVVEVLAGSVFRNPSSAFN